MGWPSMGGDDMVDDDIIARRNENDACPWDVSGSTKEDPHLKRENIDQTSKHFTNTIVRPSLCVRPGTAMDVVDG